MSQYQVLTLNAPTERIRGLGRQHPKTETHYPSKNPAVSPSKVTEHFLWDNPMTGEGQRLFQK
jgi:hypothetical protein